MATELPLSNFWIIKLVSFENYFNAANCSGVKFKGELFSLLKLTEEKPQS